MGLTAKCLLWCWTALRESRWSAKVPLNGANDYIVKPSNLDEVCCPCDSPLRSHHAASSRGESLCFRIFNYCQQLSGRVWRADSSLE